MPNIDVNTTLENLIEAWCDRREYKALAIVLPTWLANNGLTDGWGELRDALRHVHAICRELPKGDLDSVWTLQSTIDHFIRNR